MNVKKLNEIPEISPLDLGFYSMSINPNKKSKITILNLEKLVNDFPLTQVLPGFISKSYFQVQKDETKVDFSYSFPPKGPIEPGFTCMYCEQNGPNYHTINCYRPFNSSLVLSEEIPRFPGAVEGTSYDLIVKKRGQKKVASKRARSKIFTDNLELIYEYPDNTKCIIRISKNGSININYAEFNDNVLPGLLIKTINKVPDAIVQKPYTLIFSYKFMITGQFNIFPHRFNEQLIVNLNSLNTNLNIPIFKKKIGGKNVFMLNKNYYLITKYIYNSGEIVSRSNKITNPFILFTLVHPSQLLIKFTIMIYLRGSVQIKASYTDKEQHTDELELNTVYNFLRRLLSSILVYSIESNYQIIMEDSKTPKKSKIKNTIDGKQPHMCHNRPGTKAGSGDFRPIPYSFSGVCPMENYYNIPGGIKRPDGKFEPCCASYNKDGKPGSREDYRNILYNGYQVVQPDNLSYVYNPGTKIIEKRGFPGLKDLTKKQIIDFMDDNGYFNVDIFKTTEIYNLFKEEVLGELFSYINYKKIPLTYFTFPQIAQNKYMVTPINNDTIFVKLFFNKTGNGFFINNFNDVSEADTDEPSLANTLIEGYLYPFEKWIFYPTDIVYHKGVNIYQLEFYNNSKNNRYYFLKSVTEYLKNKIPIELNYDLNIINGSKYYLTLEDTSSLLFMPLDVGNIFLWSDTLHDANTTIALNVQFLNTNRWVISIGSQKIPKTLLQQGPNNDIEIPKLFSNRYLNGSGIVLFKINLKRTDHKIDQRKPFTPLSVLDRQINTYTEVIILIESINNPIPSTTFTELTSPPGFVLDHFVYYFDGIGKKLRVEST